MLVYVVSVPKNVYSYRAEKILGKELVHSSLVPEREHKISLQVQVKLLTFVGVLPRASPSPTPAYATHWEQLLQLVVKTVVRME